MSLKPLCALFLFLAVSGVSLAEDALSFPAKINAFSSEEQVRFSVAKRFAGKELVAVDGLGRAFPFKASEEGLAALERLAPGFYEVVDGLEPLGRFVVVVPQTEYPNSPSGALGVDYGMTTAGRPPAGEELKPWLQRNAELAKRAGVKRVRERLFAFREPERREDGSFFIKPGGLTELSLSISKAAGFDICAVSQGTPKALNIDGAPKRPPLSLLDSYGVYLAIGEAWGGLLDAIEIGNEIDLRTFYDGTASEYAAYCKAASLALRAKSPKTLVVQSSFARPAMKMKAALSADGLDPYFDVFNYHVYGELGATMREYAAYVVGASGRKRAWCTETGRSLGSWGWNEPGAVDFPPALSSLGARSLGPVYAENLAAGAEKVYFFYWRFSAEPMEATILDRRFMATERYAALATANRMLGDAQYAGSLIRPPVRAHLFEDGKGRRCLIAWSQGGAASLELKASGSCEIVAHSGETVFSGDASGSLRLELKELRPLYVRAVSFADAFEDLRAKSSFGAERAAKAAPSPLALELRPGSGVEYDNSLASFALPPGGRAKLELLAANFGSSAWRGSVPLSVEAPWRLEPSSVDLDLPPGREARFEAELFAPESVDKGRLLRTVSCKAEGSSAKASIQVALTCDGIRPLKVGPALPALSSTCWTQGNLDPSASFKCQPAGAGLRFRVEFLKPGPRMFWPVMEGLPAGLEKLDWSGWDAVRVRLKVSETKPGTWFVLYATELGGARYASSRLPADSPGEHSLVFPFASFSYATENSAPDGPEFSFDLDKIKTFGFGSNSFEAQERGKELYNVDYEIQGIDLLKFAE